MTTLGICFIYINYKTVSPYLVFLAHGAQVETTENMDNISCHLCDHCGETLLQSEVKLGRKHHIDCEKEMIPKCESAVRCFLESMAISSNVLYMGIDVKYLYGIVNSTKNTKKENREKRNKKLTELTELISALRNSSGGYLLVQIIGLSPDENYMGAFDEFADETLYTMIEDGSLFESVYKKGRLSDIEECRSFNNFISIFVSKGTFWSTSDFKTKISLDVGLLSPLPSTMITYVSDSGKRGMFEDEPRFKFEGNFEDIQMLQEGRDIQLKGFKPENLKCSWSEMSNYDIARTLWDVYRLKEYISAFTKNILGGSVILGIGEKEKETLVRNKDSKYRSKELEIQGIPLGDERGFEGCIEEIARDESLICSFDGEVVSRSKMTKVRCTKVPPEYVQSRCGPHDACRYIVEIVVYPVDGVVFYDKQGPVSCRIVENKAKRVDCKTWFQMMKKKCSVLKSK